MGQNSPIIFIWKNFRQAEGSIAKFLKFLDMPYEGVTLIATAKSHKDKIFLNILFFPFQNGLSVP